MTLCDRFWWQQMMQRTRAVSCRYLMLGVGYMAENIHFWQKATRAETAAWSETYQGVTMNIYHLLLHLHSIWCCLEIRQGCFVWALFLFCLRLNRHLVAIPDTQLLRIWSIKKSCDYFLNPKWCREKNTVIGITVISAYYVFLTQPLTNLKITLKRIGCKFLDKHRGMIGG